MSKDIRIAENYWKQKHIVLLLLFDRLPVRDLGLADIHSKY